MAYAKIVYPSVLIQSNGTALNFVRPARNLAPYIAKASRTDDRSGYGLKQSVLERIDHYIEFEIPFVQGGADTSGWAAFFEWALAGAALDFYADAALGAYTTCYLDMVDVRVDYKSPGWNKVTIVRLLVVIT